MVTSTRPRAVAKMRASSSRRRASAAATPAGPPRRWSSRPAAAWTPRSPSRARAGRSLRRPPTGAYSMPKSPGVHHRARRASASATAAQSGRLWVSGTNSARKGPTCDRRPRARPRPARRRPSRRCSSSLLRSSAEREAAAVDRHLARPRAAGRGHRADVVLVAVGEDRARLERVAALDDVAEVRQDDVDAHLVVLGEGDAAVDQHHVGRRARRRTCSCRSPPRRRGGSPQHARPRVAVACSPLRPRARATGCPGAPGRCAGCRAARASPRPAAGAAGADGIRPVISSAALMRMGLVVTKRPA